MTSEYIDEWLTNLTEIQRSMLYLRRDAAQKELSKWYKEIAEKFELAVEMYQSAVRMDTKKFLLKNQCTLILNNLADQSKQIEELSHMSELEIIRLFEQQLKLKKILRKFAQR